MNKLECRRNGRLFVSALALAVFVINCVPVAIGAGGSKAEWQKTVEAAKKEGRLTIYHSSVYDRLWTEFQKKYPEIKLTGVTLRGAQVSQRVMAEKRAGKQLVDFALGGAWTQLSVFHKAHMLDPITPELILPEVADETKWWNGKLPFVDPEGKHILAFNGELFLTTGYNTDLVKPGDFKSYWDLLKPKWKGKIIAQDPAVRSSGATLVFFYYTRELGPEFIRQLFGNMDLTLSRNSRQITDWIAKGRYSISLLGPVGRLNMPDAKRVGLPVSWFGAGTFVEGLPLSSGSGNAVLFKNRPHPNAARLALNWFLSREGQILYQKYYARYADGRDSMRIDIPKDDVPDYKRRVAGRKFVRVEYYKWMDMKPVMKVINEVKREKESSRR